MTRHLAWITGANGLIGSHLLESAPRHAPAWNARGLSRQVFDLTDFAALRRVFQREMPRLVIHCAAISRSSVCEENPALARKINVEVTLRLAELAAEIPIVFFSSDLVFDGRAGNYVESAPVKPLSVYAQTKTEAERAVLANPRHTVIRTSLNGGVSPTGDRGFNEEMRREWSQGRMLTLFTDEFRCPIPVSTTVRAVWELIGLNRPGLYHLAGAERLSRWQLGQLMAARWPQLNPRIQPGSLRDYRGAARSPDTSLNCAKIQKLLSFRLPGLTNWLHAHPNEPF